ncbi:hypothetical protein [Ornithinimicrobium sp. INDO-MA30-4]|nr:hypothetical protein [Ornithinimicrobium sp. INDO-MA30-4]UJH70498.1 hypothetical protein L0A91_15670 [Ornithinimicrobium sp. INDO-MA30-4]
MIALGANLEDPRKAVVRAVQHLRRIRGYGVCGLRDCSALTPWAARAA